MLIFKNEHARKSLRIHLYSTLIGILFLGVIGVTIVIGLKKVNPIYYSDVIDLEYWGLSRFTLFLMIAKTESIVILLAWIFAAIALTHGIGGILMMRYFIKKNGKKELIQKLEDEMSADSAKWFPLNKAYLTEHYFISFSNGFFALKYRDLFWIYQKNHCLTVLTEDGKDHQTANTYRHKKAADKEYSAIIDAIQENNPAVLTGFTKENLSKFNHAKKTNHKEKQNTLSNDKT